VFGVQGSGARVQGSGSIREGRGFMVESRMGVWWSSVKDAGCGVQGGSFYNNGKYVTICGKYVNIRTTHIFTYLNQIPPNEPHSGRAQGPQVDC
jgi:hypothetical protein